MFRNPKSDVFTGELFFFVQKWQKNDHATAKALLLPGRNITAMHSDHRYIEAFRRNDTLVTKEIYERFSRQTQLWVCNNSGSVADARDVFQEGVLAVYEKSLDPSFVLTCPLGALLHVICSRKWIDRLRKENRVKAVINSDDMRSMYDGTEADALSLAEAAQEADERQRNLASSFAQLSELCQRILRMLGEGKTPKEVVVALEMNSPETLYRRKNACVARWRELLNA
jgi:RNA polymerase sigma factor (sigma-70 family)